MYLQYKTGRQEDDKGVGAVISLEFLFHLRGIAVAAEVSAAGVSEPQQIKLKPQWRCEQRKLPVFMRDMLSMERIHTVIS